ncbi:unnamed protein product [Notodromas monacha]|uniref:Calpain catalytic domain-containing protein n=1 Tax=Notodromas monacha TaxID=399045 RepID=A0A7R9BS54_9CRUS|nr:unnamed protein product [Notodromas monacha]CAG0919787.1 unnamed protein product [Notodromas monacha]
MDGMVDLTGGITEMISLSDSKDLTIEKEKLLFKQLFRAFENKSFMTCGRSMGHAEVKNGLPDGHAYTITNVAYVSSQGRPEPNRLIRIKNPWASAVEWTGDWSDTDENSWSKVSEAVKSRIGHHEVHDDGQFWMNFKDFANEFSFYTICSITPDLDDNLRPDDPSTTEVKMRFGSWVGDSAGGSANKERPLATNPQYLFTIAEPDDDDDKGDCTVVIGLMQMYRRKQHAIFLSIGFRVYRANAKNPYQWLCDADLEEELGGSGSYRRLREVTGKVDLKPGNYIVIPSTAYPGEENDFMLRFFSGKSIEIHEMEES